MDMRVAVNNVKELLTENAVEFKTDSSIDMIKVIVGRISHFMHFSDGSLTIISSVEVGKNDIEVTYIDRWYKDITRFRFHNGQLWIDGNTLGCIVLNCKQD